MDFNTGIRPSLFDPSAAFATGRWAFATFATVSMCLVLPACALLGGEDATPIVRVSAGDSFGECIGYCIRTLDVDGSRTTFTAEGWSPGGLIAPIDSTHGTNAAFFKFVATGITWTRFNLLDERYGCPDCVDGGAEWIELENDAGDSKRVTFEYGHPPAPLSQLADTLQRVRIDYARRLVD